MKTGLLCLGLVLVSAVAGAVDYSLVGSSYPATWDAAGTWSQELVLPGTTGDSYTISSPTSPDNMIDLPNPANIRYFGSLTMTSGTLRLNSSVNTDTFRFAADNGQDGSFTLKGATATSVNFGKIGYNQGVNWDMDGDWIYDGQVYTSEQFGSPGRHSRVTMRGADTVFTMSGSASAGQNMVRITVESGASVNFVEPTLAGYNAVRELVINGTASGSIMSSLGTLGAPANNYFVKVGGSADVSELDLTLGLTNTTTAEYWASGAHYREFVLGGAGYIGNVATPPVWTLKLVDGDLRARNVKLGTKLAAADPRSGYFVIDTDNGGIVRNITADLDMSLGDWWWSGVVKANSANVTIGRDLLVNNPAGTTASYITATTATIKVGRHLTVANGPESLASGWDMGTSTLILNGNDNGTDQTLTTRSLPFYDVQINTTGTVTMADNLVLNGDLSLVAGTLAPGGNYVIMHGGQNTEGTAQELDLGGMDLGKLYIMQGSETWAILLSDLVVSDNLDIDTGCGIFLNGHTLTAEGDEFSGAGTWDWDQGQIVGTGVIPEPGTLLLLGTGVLGTIGIIRRRKLGGFRSS